MNQNQKIVIFIALILLLCCGIFVPYDGTETHLQIFYGTTDSRIEKANSFIGYFPIFSPPSKENIFKFFSKSTDPGSYYTYESNINLSRLLIQIFILLIITIGIVLLSSGENKKSWWDWLKK